MCRCIQPSTKVIVMDTDGRQSKEIARALRGFGVRVRILAELFLPQFLLFGCGFAKKFHVGSYPVVSVCAACNLMRRPCLWVVMITEAIQGGGGIQSLDSCWLADKT